MNENHSEAFWRSIPGSRHGVVRGVLIGYNRFRAPWPAQIAHAKAKVPGVPELEVTVEFESRDGERVISEVIVRSPTQRLPRRGIDWTALRRVPLDGIQREVSHLIAREEKLGRLPKRLGDALRQRPGSRGRGDLEYAQVAAAYVAALDGRAPNQTVAKQLRLSPSSVRDLLHEARRRGLLTTLGRGKVGGELTEKALKLLEKG